MLEIENLIFYIPTTIDVDGNLKLLINILSNSFTISLSTIDFIVVYFFNKNIQNKILELIC